MLQRRNLVCDRHHRLRDDKTIDRSHSIFFRQKCSGHLEAWQRHAALQKSASALAPDGFSSDRGWRPTDVLVGTDDPAMSRTTREENMTIDFWRAGAIDEMGLPGFLASADGMRGRRS
jgi:hypothetical protein